MAKTGEAGCSQLNTIGEKDRTETVNAIRTTDAKASSWLQETSHG